MDAEDVKHFGSCVEMDEECDCHNYEADGTVVEWALKAKPPFKVIWTYSDYDEVPLWGIKSEDDRYMYYTADITDLLNALADLKKDGQGIAGVLATAVKLLDSIMRADEGQDTSREVAALEGVLMLAKGKLDHWNATWKDTGQCPSQ